MKLDTAFAYACRELEQTGHVGHLVNQSMLAFIFCNALMHELPDAQIVYDGRVSRDCEAKPNLFIWLDGAVPVVHFIGNIKYGRYSDTDGWEQIKSLENCAGTPTIPVLTSHPMSSEYDERQMAVSQHPKLGLFLVNEQKIEFQYWSAHGKRGVE